MFKVRDKNGDKCPLGVWVKIERYIILGDYEKAMDCLEELYEKRDMDVTYIATIDFFISNEIRDNPRYIALLEKMNLTVD